MLAKYKPESPKKQKEVKYDLRHLSEMNENFLERNVNFLKVSLIELYMELCISFFITAEDLNQHYRDDASN